MRINKGHARCNAAGLKYLTEKEISLLAKAVKEKDLDDLDKKENSGPTASLRPTPTVATGANNFGSAMKGGASSF